MPRKESPFRLTNPTPQGLVTFWVERPEYVRIGKQAAKMFLEELLGPVEAKAALRSGFFWVDDEAKAIQCVKILKGLRDMHVSQYVFGARPFKALD